jgi:hypothetical protein
MRPVGLGLVLVAAVAHADPPPIAAHIEAQSLVASSCHSDDRTPWQLAWVHLPDGQPPALGKTITIPSCRGP